MTGITRATNLPFQIAAGETLQFGGGSLEFIYLAEVSAGADLYLNCNQASLPLVVGRRVPFGKPETGTINIENRGSGTVSGVLFIGSGDVRDSTVVGTVSVVDGSLETVKSGKAFTLYENEAPSVGNYCHKEIKNIGSVDIILNRIFFQQVTSANVDIVLGKYTAQLSSLGAGEITNKKIGEAAPTEVEARSQLNGSPLPMDFEMMVKSVAQYEWSDIQLSEPILLEPGERFGVICKAPNNHFTLVVHGYVDL